jgi:hypothetical protein
MRSCTTIVGETRGYRRLGLPFGGGCRITGQINTLTALPPLAPPVDRPISTFEIVVPAAGIRLTPGVPLAIGELLSVTLN